MSLFGPNRPKGITKGELYFIRGELLAGHGVERLAERQVDYVVELLEMALDPDSPIEMRNHWEQVDQAEEKNIEEKLGDNDVFKFTELQKKRVHAVLQKYIDTNRVKSFL